MTTLSEAVTAYMERFDDSPPYDVLFSMDEEQGVRAITRALRDGKPLEEDPAPGPIGRQR